MARRTASRIFSSAIPLLAGDRLERDGGSAAGDRLGVHALVGIVDHRVGPCLRPPGGLVDLGLDLGPDGFVDLVGQDASLSQLARELRDRVLLLEVLDLRRIAIAALVVVRGVRGEAHDAGLDERRSLAAAGALMCLLRRRVAAEHVAAVDDDARHPVTLGAGRDRPTRHLAVERDADRVAVVLAHEDDGQLVHAGEVHRLVDLALVRGALAVLGHRHDVVAADPGPHGDPDGVEDLRSDRGAQRDDVVRRAAVVPGHLSATGAHVIALGEVGGDDVLGAHPERDRARDGPIERRHPVVMLPHRPGDADLRALVALARDDEGDLAGPLHEPHPLVDPTGEKHVAVHVEHLLVREAELGVSQPHRCRRHRASLP
jgi:hypothetical protein